MILLELSCSKSSRIKRYPTIVPIIPRQGPRATNPRVRFKGSVRNAAKMGFIMEFAENLVLRLMEDPKERDKKFREHLYSVKERCNKTKEMWSYPLRPYGFWTFERHNAQLRWDAQISQVPGRRDPYDDLLENSFDTSTK
ncbi:NADH-ubiquinone oxidoreductase 11kDa subunit - like 1 [Theobroma cacao]|nr:NADH-ubiquinone oxidoreductase 11kDa subunit - like 1 [Theobroma cacao]